MSRISFRTAGLATLALTGSLVLAGPASHAASVPCEPLPTADIITTIVHPPVTRSVDAVTHTEWAWERDLAVYEAEYTKTLVEASLEIDWSREVPGPVEHRFARIVIDQAAVPAVPGTPEVGHHETVLVAPAVIETEDEFEHETTGAVRWERADWAAQNGQGKGWKKTGATREVETVPAVTTQRWVVDAPAVPGTPAVAEVSRTESAWALSSPGAGWTATGESRPGVGSSETASTAGAAPSGDGWREVARREAVAVLETVWASQAPEGFSPTGSARVASIVHERTAGTSAAAPTGEGWLTVAGSEIVVTDVAAYDEVVTEGWIEMLLSPPQVPEGCGIPTEAVEGPRVAEEPVVTQVVAPADATPAVVVDQVLAQGAAAAVPTVLPNTGGTSGWLASTGFASMLAGAAVALGARRRSAR